MKRPLWQFFCLLALLITLSVFFPQANAQADAIIRVYLRRLQVQDSLHIAVEGTYMLEDGSMYFQNGAQLDVVLREGQLAGEIRDDVSAELIAEMFHSIYQAAAFSKLSIGFQENVALKTRLLLAGIRKQ